MTTEPLDLAWARRCAKDFADKPTDARARNAAQCLAGLLDLVDALMKPGPTDPAALRAVGALHRPGREDPTSCYECSLLAYPASVPWPCPTARAACEDAVRREDAVREVAAKLDMPPEIAANPDAYTWRKAGIDPCPARSHKQESCLKGYLHRGGHEWGGTKTVEAGPDLGQLGEPSEDPAQRPHNCRCTIGIDSPPDASNLPRARQETPEPRTGVDG